MFNAEELFKEKSEFNKWLKELTESEKSLIIEMINIAQNSGKEKILYGYYNLLMDEFNGSASEEAIDMFLSSQDVS